MSSLFANIRIVLVESTHPGNIGAAARAMKTMGLGRLYLVAPKIFPHAKATARAAQATDILDQAVVVDTLEQALADCQLVLGTSARVRELTWPTLDARQATQKIMTETTAHQIAIVFGREKSGLTNEEIQCCHYQIEIPSNPVYSSLNLAAAVQVICYELYMCRGDRRVAHPDDATELATSIELEGFYTHLEQTLYKIDFLKPEHPKMVMGRLRRIFNRTRLDKTELNILRGILTSVQRGMT